MAERTFRCLALVLAIWQLGSTCLGSECEARRDVCTGEISRALQDAQSIENYRAQLKAFNKKAIADKSINYADSIAFLYRETAVTKDDLDAKRQWRSDWGGEFVFVTDYEWLEQPVSVETLKATDDPNLGSTLVAC